MRSFEYNAMHLLALPDYPLTPVLLTEKLGCNNIIEKIKETKNNMYDHF